MPPAPRATQPGQRLPRATGTDRTPEEVISSEMTPASAVSEPKLVGTHLRPRASHSADEDTGLRGIKGMTQGRAGPLRHVRHGKARALGRTVSRTGGRPGLLPLSWGD